MFWAARALHWCAQTVFLAWKSLVILQSTSWWGSIFAILNLERGIPSKLGSSAHADCVPALCTHRPSLLPIEWSGELFGPTLRRFSALCGKVSRTLSFRGRRSRNKVSVGEPAEGSFACCASYGWIVCVFAFVQPSLQSSAIRFTCGFLCNVMY